MEIAILLLSFLLLLIFRVPVALALVISSLLTAFSIGIPLEAIIQRMVGGLDSFSLLAIPFFILAGEIMNEGGISRRLINLSNLVVGKIRGGLALVNVISSTFFGGISGSAVADVSSTGSVLIPMMKKKGYDDDYTVAVTVSSSAQGVILPPSHNMIIYSTAAGGVSISALFMGGVLPGLLLAVALMITAYIIAVKRNYPTSEPMKKEDVPGVLKEGVLGLLTAVIIIGGIISGIFTATESAAIGAIYAFIISFFVYRDVPLRNMRNVLQRTFKTLSMILFLIAASSGFGWLLALLRVPSYVSDSLLAISPNDFVTLLLINLILLLLGTIMDMAPLILIATPIFLPIVLDLGMDPVHFGIILMLNLSIGLITPPVGACLFVGAAIAKIPMEKSLKALLPFYFVMIIVLLMITFWSDLVLFLPERLAV
ncbi:TRAP transporter large permease [Alkalicoccobacillus porphyridii]|uniref:TRAP transporter large permease n=1 Tax=Alkalicoccobacillus porphyridii TaxID=2597270 RepID=A0A554A0Q5_9BACI|nr:TRAP transporter large permease [Alkalicoccobacillus porphyridii]TSB47270.1 TRAP transporter large permease [Alkalicoccobacillus porphyridii]